MTAVLLCLAFSSFHDWPQQNATNNSNRDQFVIETRPLCCFDETTKMADGDIEMQDAVPSTSGVSLKPDKKRFEVKKV